MSVNILHPEIVKHIAAGEVVENPASVVKELAENALDAGADRVEISVQEGGIKSIQVTDNGEGVLFDDLPLIFQRYATSKIARLEDLAAITSLGFRGEALPSIAAVSRLTATSRRRGEPAGGLIMLEGGKLIGNREAGAPEGTEMLVKDLFFNTPARLKFLKSPPVETGRISFLLWELSLGHPRVSFSLRSNGRNLLQTSGDGSLPSIMGAIHGNKCAGSLLELDYRYEEVPIEISGYLSTPYYHRSSRRGITVIVNGRPVKAPQIVYALERGYGTLLPRGRYPVAVIGIRMPPDLLDVNVHPSKTMVRFQHPKMLSDLVYRTVKSVLEKRMPLPHFKNKTGGASPDLYSRGSAIPADRIAVDAGELVTEGGENISLYRRQAWDLEEEPKLPGTDAASLPQMETGRMRLIGQFLHSYLVAQRGEELLLIDQHAAHERILYHKLISSPPGHQAVQLTLPLEIEIPPPWRERFAELKEALQGLGFKLEPFGDNNYIIRSLPVLLRGEITGRDIQDLLEALLSEEPEPGMSKQEQVCRDIACQQAIKAKQALTFREMEALLDELQSVPGYQYCPHGRPSIISFQRTDLDKMFRRKGGK